MTLPINTGVPEDFNPRVDPNSTVNELKDSRVVPTQSENENDVQIPNIPDVGDAKVAQPERLPRQRIEPMMREVAAGQPQTPSQPPGIQPSPKKKARSIDDVAENISSLYIQKSLGGMDSIAAQFLASPEAFFGKLKEDLGGDPRISARLDQLAMKHLFRISRRGRT